MSIARKAMQSLLSITDIARNIVPLLDNATIFTLYQFGIIPSLSSLVLETKFWYERVYVLADRYGFDQLPYSLDVNWKQTYHLLLAQTEMKYPDFYNDEDNATVLVYVGSVFTPCNDELARAVIGNKPNILAYLLSRDDLPSDEVLELETNEWKQFETEEDGPILIIAARYGYTECVRLLLTRPELNPHVIGYGGQTPLQVACRSATMDKQDEYATIVHMLLSCERPIPAFVVLERLIRSVDCPRVAIALLSYSKLFPIEQYGWLMQYYERRDLRMNLY